VRLAPLVVLLFVVPLAAQTRKETHSPLGLSLAVPRSYSPMPVQPTETCVQLRYLGAESKQGLRPDLWVIAIEHGPDPDPLPDPPPQNTLERFLAQRMKPWAIAETKGDKPVEGWSVFEHRLERKLEDAEKRVDRTGADFPWAACALERRLGTKSWVVLGFCDVEDVEQELKTWRAVLAKMQFFEPTAAAEEKKWARYYQFKPEFKNGALRTRLRSRLLDGWKWEDTANFVFLTSSDKAQLMRDLTKKLEGTRKYYATLFPPVAEIEAVSTVRVCQDREEYMEYGGSARSAGYWNSAAEELVFFENGKEDTRIVLYHEAFHQYVYYAVGEVNPHPWFNEGYGDYFSGAEFNTSGDVVRIRMNPWRVPAIKYFLGQCPSWAELVKMDQVAFMAGAEMHYPMAWSMVYFLRESKEAAAHADWQAILPRYYEGLKASYPKERARLAAEKPDLDARALAAEASEPARAAALAAAFEGIDLDELQRVWMGFVLALKPPK
jgi:hypothetical protein